MKGRIICKGLVFAVILLFVGVSLQPAVAIPQSEIIDIKLRDMDKGELNIKINEIVQKYIHIPMVSHIFDKLIDSTFIFSWIYLFLYVIVVGIGLFLYVILKFYDYYYWI